MTMKIHPKFFVASVLASFLACSTSSTSPPSTIVGADSDSGVSSSSGGAIADCVPRCSAVASACAQPSSQCAAQCGSLTEVQLTCLESAGCEPGAIKKCLAGGTGGTDAGPKTDGGATACIAVGATGCSSLNAPSGCCTDAKRTKVVCNGNNDGKGNAQCCVDKGNGCSNVADCCGYAGAPDSVKALYSCSAGVCKF
jgi:hypothetical protein